MDKMTHKVAIVTHNIKYGNDYDEVDRWFVRQITEWEEVSHDDFLMLQQGILIHNSKYGNNVQFMLVEYPQNQHEIIFDTIQKGKEYFAEMDRRRKEYEEEQRLKREKTQKLRAEKKLLKKADTLEDKKKLLALLQEQIDEEESKK